MRMKHYLLAAALMLAASPANPAGRQPTMQEAVAEATSDIDQLRSDLDTLRYKVQAPEKKVNELESAR